LLRIPPLEIADLMKKYQKIYEARKLLELPERATMDEIKTSYRSLIKKWHPDKRNAPDEECAEMTDRIINAYRTILDYCESYKYSFSEKEVKNYLSDEEWWFERFGEDPLWGKSSTEE
jgi:DnaJ-class molecular chaperone